MEQLFPTAEEHRIALLLHGAGGGGWEWNAWLPVFEERGWTVLSPSLQPAAEGIAATRFKEYRRQILALASTQPAFRLAIVGASMGGLLALSVSEALKPSALILVNGVPPSGFGWNSKGDYPDVVRWSQGTIEETREAMPDSDESTVRLAFERWRDESGAVLREIADGIEVSPPQCPVLIMAGELDQDIPASVSRQVAQAYRADLLVYDRMSHVGPLLGTRAAKVARDAVDWLDDHVR
ncbi:MAG: alpha/beta fold hydrolase [Fimbriimonas sp.]|nr:alpha/beta fold hydrolase [Fimbriimonas sp.]